MIVAFLLQDILHIQTPTYLDVGAFDPVHLSNTYYFYQQGSRGVCIEPDPVLCSRIQRTRKRDICLNVGVGAQSKSSADFYILAARTLNTFSCDATVTSGRNAEQAVEQVIQVPLWGINEIIETHFDRCPNYISLDTEGLDLAILRTFNFGKYRPEVFCVETLDYSGQTKETEIEPLMKQNGYAVYADTHINTIFVDEAAFARTPPPPGLQPCQGSPS